MPAVDLPDLSGLALAASSRRALADGRNCPCGQRRPLGVLLGLRSGGRPRLDGQWFCRRECLEVALMERARRDFPERSVGSSRMRHRVPLGLILQARGVISATELQRALRLQSATGQRLGQVLTDEFGVQEDRITGAIAAQWGLPVLHPGMLGDGLERLAPPRLFRASGCVPVERSHDRLLLATAEGPDAALALALERMHPALRVEFGIAAGAVLDRWRDEHEESVQVQCVACTDRECLVNEAAARMVQMQPVESRVVRIGRLWWLRVWLEESAAEPGTAPNEDTVDVLFSMRPSDSQA